MLHLCQASLWMFSKHFNSVKPVFLHSLKEKQAQVHTNLTGSRDLAQKQLLKHQMQAGEWENSQPPPLCSHFPHPPCQMLPGVVSRWLPPLPSSLLWQRYSLDRWAPKRCTDSRQCRTAKDHIGQREDSRQLSDGILQTGENMGLALVQKADPLGSRFLPGSEHQFSQRPMGPLTLATWICLNLPWLLIPETFSWWSPFWLYRLISSALRG